LQIARTENREPRTENREPGHQSSIVNRQSSIPNLHFPPGESATAWANAWLSQQLAPGERLVVLHPGTGGPSKLWLPERWAAVAHELATLSGVRLLLTGGPGEEALVATIAAQIVPAPLTLVGSMAVPQLAALLGRAALVLGVDSGPLHLAVSQAVPTLHLFGPSDAGRFGPWGNPARHVVLRAGLWCSPCGVFSACPRGTHPPECMERIAVATVVQAARMLLKGDRRPGPDE
jgi:ADP-heptose:LPS heptosyltransferase